LRNSSREKGQIPTPILWALLSLLAAAAMAMVLIATGSKGGIGAAAVGLTMAPVAWRWRHRLARRYKTVAVTAAAILVAGLLGVWAYGSARGTLPSKTLAVRWFYWQGSARIVSEHPLRGVGPGNFGSAYTQVRPPEAEEEVKTPHNFIAHAFTQFGLPGGAVYLAILGGAVLLAVRPVRASSLDPASFPGQGARIPMRLLMGAFAAVILAATLSRWGFSLRETGNAAAVVADLGFPLLGLLAGLFVMAWVGECWCQLPPRSFALLRLALAAGAAAFVIHNLVSFGLWTPATGTLFWLVVGAAVAGGPPSRPLKLPFVHGVLTVVLLAGILAGGSLLLRPVYHRLGQTQELSRQLQSFDIRRWRQVSDTADRAARADTLDPYSALTAAQVTGFLWPREAGELTRQGAERTGYWLAETRRRDPRDAEFYRYTAQVRLRYPGLFGDADANLRAVAADLARAVDLDPSNAPLRIDYAEALLAVGRQRQALEELAAAERINERLREFAPESFDLLNASQRQRLRELRSRAEQRAN
jgi:O-antigen ligase